MKTKVILEKVRNLLSKPQRWTKSGSNAVDYRGHPLVYGTEPEACRWCVQGAIGKVTGGEYKDWQKTIDVIEKKLGLNKKGLNLWQFNDAINHSDLIASLDKVINSL